MCIGGGNFLTQSTPTYFHQFFTRKVLTPNERIDDFMEVTQAQRDALEAVDATFVEPPHSFIDQWNDACEDDGTYNPDTGYFELNGIIDIPYDEAIRIYNAWSWGYSGKSFINVLSDDIHIRTLIPIRARQGSDSVDLKGICSNNKSIECINIQISSSSEISSIYFSFFNCIKLHTIKGLLTLTANAMSTGAFMNCYDLETVYINRLRGDIDFKFSSKISLESLSYMINNANNTNNIAITTHPDVYAKLTGDTTNAAAAALTPDELGQWMALVETAAEKNITFATA